MLQLLALVLSGLLASTAVLAQDTAAFAPTRFSVRVEGSGPDVILIHGLASSADVWQSTASALRARHRVHVLQVAGFGGAPAGANASGPVLEPLVEELRRYVTDRKLEAPALIGHSMGGVLALMLAARQPERVGRVLVVDALPFFPLLRNPAATPESARPQADAMRTAILALTREQFDAAQRSGAGRLVKSESARPAVAEAAARSDASVVARVMHELMTTDLRPELGRISAPTRVLYAYDPVYGVPPAAADDMFRGAYAGLRTAKLERVDSSLHFVMYDQPERFASAVEEFLRPG